MNESTPKKSLIETTLFKRFVPFHQLSEKHIQEIAKYAVLKKIPPKTLIFKRNVKLNHTYYLVSGGIDLCDAQYNVKAIESTAEAPFKAPLNSSDISIHAAISTTNVAVLIIDSDKLDLVLTWSEAGDYLVEDVNDQESDEDWMSDLLQSNLLQRIPPSNIQQLFTSFKHESFAKGQSIIKEGDPGERFYVISQGQAEVSRLNEQGESLPLAHLATGKFFGEEALISDAPRNASVTMLTDLSLIHI